MFVDGIVHLAHLHARDTSFALVSRAPTTKLEAYKKRMGWTIPWYSSFESDFNVDFDVGPERPQEDVYQDGESFGLSVFIREDEDVPTVSAQCGLSSNIANGGDEIEMTREDYCAALALDSIRPKSGPIWASWPERERRRFLRHARPYWEVHRHRMAPEITR